MPFTPFHIGAGLLAKGASPKNDNDLPSAEERLPVEIWKDIRGFEGSYRVSNTGFVASIDRISPNGKRRKKGRVLRPWYNTGGQPQVYLSIDGARHRFLVSRLVAAAFIREIDSVDQVAHLDLNKKNNYVNNLKIMTHKEVMALTNKILCDFEFIASEDMTKDKLRKYFDYNNGELIWKLRPALNVLVGKRAGFLQDGHFRIHFCGNTYMHASLVYMWHFGTMPDYVLPKNRDYKDCRIENLYACTASQWATISDRVANFGIPHEA